MRSLERDHNNEIKCQTHGLEWPSHFNCPQCSTQNEKKWRDLQRKGILIILHYKWLWSKADHITDHCSAQLLSETKTQRPSRGLVPTVSKKYSLVNMFLLEISLLHGMMCFFHLYCFFPLSLLIQIPEIVSKLSENGRKGIYSSFPFMEFVELEEGTCRHISHGYKSKLGMGGMTKILNCSTINFINHNNHIKLLETQPLNNLYNYITMW